MKIFSIIIATFNAAKTLERCLNSIVNQLDCNSELILIDGGSSDETLAIVNKYKNYITYSLSEPDEGIYDAWNKGIKVSNGKWIMFVGADDILLPNTLINYKQFLENIYDQNSYDYISGQAEYVDNNGLLLNVIGSKADWKHLKYSMVSSHVASLHNKNNLFDKVGLYNFKDYHISADYELLLRKKDQLYSLFMPVCVARMQTGGMSFSINALNEKFRIRKSHKTLPLFINSCLYFVEVIIFKTFNVRHKLLNVKKVFLDRKS